VTSIRVTTDADRLAHHARQAAAEVVDLYDVNVDAAADVLGFVDPPIRTGRLASTVEAVPEAMGFVLRAGGPDAPYAPAVHARDPFLREALNDRQQAVVDHYIDHAERVADTLKGK